MVRDRAIDRFVKEVEQSPEVKAAGQRAKVYKLARDHSAEALRQAHAIQLPWYRCQALSFIVDARPNMAGAEAILLEAMDAAFAQQEPNRIASVAAWPLSVVVRRGIGSPAKHVQKLLAVIAAEPHGLRRLHGQAAILGSILNHRVLREMVLPAFVRTLSHSSGWRTERIAGAVAQSLVDLDRGAASTIVKAQPASRFNRGARLALGLE